MTASIVFEAPPALAHDAMMLAEFKHHVSERGMGERIVVWNLLRHLERSGFELVLLDDGESVLDLAKFPEFLTRARAAMELAFNLDECSIGVRKTGTDRVLNLWMVFGNSPEEVCSDYSAPAGDPDGFVEAMNEFNALIDSGILSMVMVCYQQAVAQRDLAEAEVTRIRGQRDALGAAISEALTVDEACNATEVVPGCDEFNAVIGILTAAHKLVQS